MVAIIVIYNNNFIEGLRAKETEQKKQKELINQGDVFAWNPSIVMRKPNIISLMVSFSVMVPCHL